MGEALSSLLFQPPPPSRLKQSKLVWLKTSKGYRIPAFHIETPEAEFTLLYSHANAEDLGNVYPWCKFLAKMLKVNVFAYDYTGYGLSDGNPSESNCFADINAAYQYLVEDLGIEPSKVVLYGRSLGTGPSCHLAMKTAELGKSIGGLVLHAPFLSIYRIVIESGCTLLGDRFSNVDYAPHIKCPVLIIHGKKDNIVPFCHSEQLLLAFAEQYRTTPLFIKDMGHNHVHALFRPLFVERLSGFIKDHVRKSNTVSQDEKDTVDSLSPPNATNKMKSGALSSRRVMPTMSMSSSLEDEMNKSLLAPEKQRSSQRLSSRRLKRVFHKRKMKNLSQ